MTNKILLGDCQDVLRHLPDNSIDLVVTDPPYVVGYRSRDGRSIAGDTTDEWLAPAFRAIYRVLKPHRYCVSFYGYNKAEAFLSAWRTAGFRLVAQFIWVKQYPSSQRIVQRFHEQAYVLSKGLPQEPEELLADVRDWQYTGNRLHPTQKPVSALRPLVGAFSRPGEVVLDPFAGSGSTLVAARQLGRRYIGIEVNTDYWRTAQKRLSRAAY